MRLRTLKKIDAGTEITSKHGPDFFEKFECKCATCSAVSDNQNNNLAALATFDGLRLRSRIIPRSFSNVNLPQFKKSVEISTSDSSADCIGVSAKLVTSGMP